MELELSLQILWQTKEGLNTCWRTVRTCAEELSGVLTLMESCMAGEAGYEMQKRLSRYQQNTAEDSRKIKELCLCLEQVWEAYGQCEEELKLWQER